MLPPLVDTHCHLTHGRFAADLPEMLARAREAGLGRVITIATGLADGVAAKRIAAAKAEESIGS